MSNAPQLDLQFERDPVLTGPGEFTLQSDVPLSVPGSGVPAAASCHSRFVSSRFPESRHSCPAWNQLMQAVGSTPGMETAYTPGLGGLDPGIGVHCALGGKFSGKPGEQDGDGESCVAQPPVRSGSVAVPAWTLYTSEVFDGGICQTLAS